VFFQNKKKSTNGLFLGTITNGLLIIRIERVNLKQIRSIAKVIGTLVTFAGALMMILYKGPPIHLFYSPNTAHQASHNTQNLKHWVSGTLFLLLGCVAWSSFFILQAIIILFLKICILFNSET
jgi:hypothetical protein